MNGDDPEAVMFATQVAVDYRNQFRKDVILICFVTGVEATMKLMSPLALSR